jgi:hypothetical protein
MPILTYEQKKEVLLQNLVHQCCLMKGAPNAFCTLKEYFEFRLMDWSVPSYMAKDEIFEIVKPLITIEYEAWVDSLSLEKVKMLNAEAEALIGE